MSRFQNGGARDVEILKEGKQHGRILPELPGPARHEQAEAKASPPPSLSPSTSTCTIIADQKGAAVCRRDP